MKHAARGDLVIIRRTEQTDSGTRAHHFELGTVASATRDGLAKTVRNITGTNTARPVRLDESAALNTLVIPASRFYVTPALDRIRADRTDLQSGQVPVYDSPAVLLRDLAPFHAADPDCLAELRAVAVRHLIEDPDARCATCGVITHDHGSINYDDDRCPFVACAPACPIGVDFTTNYPVGLSVRITRGFAEGATATIESVGDAYPPDLDGRTYYAGRSYFVTLPFWGRRGFPEQFVCPTDETAITRYAVRRATSVQP
ncbi:hypothetical protein [Dactylosporangium sp. CA-139066]|uniref:hypothetical protein n=1 Tax=Dactylosporangium sp. CA-139066 TaxID=3239930 RepID=UPI003D924491